MRNALRELVLRGAVSLTVCALATLFVIGLLSVLAENLPPKAQTDADLASGSACNATSCVTKAKHYGRKLGSREPTRALISAIWSGKRRIFRRNRQFADDGERTANCSELTQREEEHRAAISIQMKSGPARTCFGVDWPSRRSSPILKLKLKLWRARPISILVPELRCRRLA